MLLGSDYPLLSIFWSILFFFVFFLWIFLLIQVLVDVFRSHDMGGVAKALWVLFIIVLPFLGVLIYLIARGGKMQQHQIDAAKQQEAAFSEYVKHAGGGSNVADQLHKLSDLKDKGVITQGEFDAQKAKLLS
jgi:hypothetical protein